MVNKPDLADFSSQPHPGSPATDQSKVPMVTTIGRIHTRFEEIPVSIHWYGSPCKAVNLVLSPCCDVRQPNGPGENWADKASKAIRLFAGGVEVVPFLRRIARRTLVDKRVLSANPVVFSGLNRINPSCYPVSICRAHTHTHQWVSEFEI